MIQNQNEVQYFESKWQLFYNFAQRHPRSYTTVTAAVAMLGYAILLFFPGMFLYGATRLLTLHIESYTLGTVFYIGFWSGVTILSGFISMQLSRISFRSVEGVSLQAQLTNKIQLLLEEIAVKIDIPHVDNIVITEQVSIDLVKIPRFAFPVWSSNTLVVGLPLMQCLSPEYFECAVVRKLLQHSKQNSAVVKWLHQLRSIWLLYAYHIAAKRTLGQKLIAKIFRYYAPFYRDLAVPIANHVELLADHDTLSIINDEDLLQTIEKVIVTKIFMDKEYWPKIAKLQKQGLTLSIKPYSNLEQTLKQDLTTKSAKRWLDSLFEHESHRMHALPSLRTRMTNIGRNRIRIPERTMQSAADYYLDKEYSDVITRVNQLWLQRNSKLAGNLRNPTGKSPQPPTLKPSLAAGYRGDILQ